MVGGALELDEDTIYNLTEDELDIRWKIGSALGRTKLMSLFNPELEGGEAMEPEDIRQDAIQELHAGTATQAVAWYLCDDISAYNRTNCVINPIHNACNI